MLSYRRSPYPSSLLFYYFVVVYITCTFTHFLFELLYVVTKHSFVAVVVLFVSLSLSIHIYIYIVLYMLRLLYSLCIRFIYLCYVSFADGHDPAAQQDRGLTTREVLGAAVV